MRKTNKKSISLDAESYYYLRNKMHMERSESGTPISKTGKLWSRVLQQTEGGKKIQVLDGGLGGCKGGPARGYEEGRWTSWSVEDMAKMLDEAGLPYEIGDMVETIEL